MQYGLTQFGRPLAASLVTAAGTAVCAASATGNAQKTRMAGSTATAKATVTLAPKRTATAHPNSVNCTATGQGRGATQFRSISGLATALAQVSGRPRVDFVAAASVANAYGRTDAHPLRRARGFARQAQAFAAIDGQGYIFELAYPSPARATARGFGTTYQTGHGEALATAAITGQASWASGAAGHALAEVTASAAWAFTGGAQGVGTGRAVGFGDAGVRRSGVRYFEGVGVAKAIANALITTLVIYQSQTARAFARWVQSSIQTRGARGLGKATATGIGDALTAGTAATLLTGDTHAFASGRAQLAAHARGVGSVKATGNGAPLVRQTKSYGAPAGAFAMVSGSAIVRSTKASPDTAYGAATLKGRAFRVFTVYGTAANASAKAVDVAFVRTLTAVGVALATASLGCTPRKTLVFAGYAEAFALGNLSYSVLGTRGAVATALAAISVTVLRTQYAQGVGSSVATATAYNQVNDLLRAPAVRTVVVEVSPRLFEVLAENRLLAA